MSTAMERKLESLTESNASLRNRIKTATGTPTTALLAVGAGALIGGAVDEASRARGGGPLSRFVAGAAIVGGYALRQPALIGLGVGMAVDVLRSAGASLAGQIMPPAAPAATTPA